MSSLRVLGIWFWNKGSSYEKQWKYLTKIGSPVINNELFLRRRVGYAEQPKNIDKFDAVFLNGFQGYGVFLFNWNLTCAE